MSSNLLIYPMDYCPQEELEEALRQVATDLYEDGLNAALLHPPKNRVDLAVKQIISILVSRCWLKDDERREFVPFYCDPTIPMVSKTGMSIQRTISEIIEAGWRPVIDIEEVK